jgi:hypothetical protein
MVLLLAALLGLAAAMIVLYPLLGLQGEMANGVAAGPADLTERERAAKGALRELEFDYRLGNLEATDYAALRERYEARALATLQSRSSHERALDALIDRQLEVLRAEGLQIGKPIDRRAATPSPARAKRAPARRRRGGGVSRG